jgi:hypothetical protein
MLCACPTALYLHGLSDRVRHADSEDDGDGKTKASVKAGSCSIHTASGGLDESLIERQTLPIAMIEFLHSISFPQQKVIARFSTG